MIVRKLSIDKYRSLYNFELKCKPLTVLIGANDAGKSNALRAFQLLFDENVAHLSDRYDWSRTAGTGRFPREITVKRGRMEWGRW